MRVSDQWSDFEILDACDGERLERWGNILLIRPDPQVIWQGGRQSPLWEQAHARYHRSSTGGGNWEYYKKVPEVWPISFSGLTFRLKPMGFKHTGIFPEQAVNWEYAQKAISQAGRPVRVLNLFSYTGAATLACAAAGASVVHVDASKGMVAWARENAKASGLEDKPVRWIVDDCVKFVQRELRRESRYEAIIMDPPSYGRGPDGEIWKLEEQLYPLLELCGGLLSDAPLFFMVNSYTTGLAPSVMSYMLRLIAEKRFGGSVLADEIGLKVSSTGFDLPCGATAIWSGEK